MPARTVYYTATTLDGFIADASDSLSWLFVQDNEPDGFLGYEQFIANVGALLMGATTYQWVCDHVASTGESWPYTQPTWVMTHRSLPSLDGADVQFAAGGVADVHARLVEAAAGKDVWVVGGGDLAGQLADVGLLDEIIVTIAPVTIGEGRPLLPRRLQLRVIESGRNGGFVATRYSVERTRDW